MAKDDKKDKDNKDSKKDKDKKDEATTSVAATTTEDEDEKKKKDKDKKNKTGTSTGSTSKKLKDDKDKKDQKPAKTSNYLKEQQKAADKAAQDPNKFYKKSGQEKYRQATNLGTDAATGNTTLQKKSGETIIVDSKGRKLETNKAGEVKTDKETGKAITSRSVRKDEAKDVSTQMEAGDALTGILNAASAAKSGRKVDNQGISSRYGKRADDEKQGKGAVYAWSNVNDDGSLKTGKGGSSGSGSGKGSSGTGMTNKQKTNKKNSLSTKEKIVAPATSSLGTDQVIVDYD